MLVIMSIIGPRETHDYRNYNLLVRGTNTSKPKKKKKKEARSVRTFSRICVVSRIVRTWKWLRRSSGESVSSTEPSIACSRKRPLYLVGRSMTLKQERER